MKLQKIFSFFLFMGLSFFVLQTAQADKGWIDVHFHIVGDKGENEGFLEAAEKTIELMDDHGIEKVIVMSPPRPFQSFDIDELEGIQKKYGARVAIIGGGGTLNPMLQKAGHSNEVSQELKKEFEMIAEKIIAKGAKGFGEITAHHVSLNPGHGYESVPANHPLLLLLADIAARHNVPIDLHFDPIPEDMETPSELSSPKNPAVLKENISAFEELLSHNRKAKIVWAHAGSDPVGFYTPELVSKLLGKHPNLYCSIRTTFKRNNPMRHPKHGVNDDWIDVVKEYPDRFVMGTDSFVITPGYSGPDGPRVFARHRIQIEGVNEVLSSINSDLADKIGRTNAIKIYNLTDL
jgi:predicted TIM-barrel fold metal-dependent hydrolase